MDIIDKLHAMQVKRYPISHMNRDQSVAEHSFAVTMIALELVMDQGDPNLIMGVMGYGLAHDLDEVFTGDIPSPFKRKLREQCPEVIPVLDGEPKAPKSVRDVVKIADYLESLYFIKEFGGSRYATEEMYPDVKDNLLAFLESGEVDQHVVSRADYLMTIMGL